MREMVEATTAKARSVRGEVESRIATLAAAANVSATGATEEIASRLKASGEILRCAGIVASLLRHVTQQLEQ